MNSIKLSILHKIRIRINVTDSQIEILNNFRITRKGRKTNFLNNQIKTILVKLICLVLMKEESQL
jgi:hypothetical protein